MSDHAAAYRALRERVVDLVARLDDDAARARVPATPEWSIHDLLAHLVGVTTDVLAGNIAGAGTDPWTKEQVDARDDATVAELLAEWAANGPQLEAALPAFPATATGQLVFDAATHEHDLRHALGRAGARDSDAVEIGFTWLAAASAGRTAAAFVLETEGGAVAFGTGEPVAHARTSRFDALRAATGRRSRAQIEAWVWEPAPRADLVVVSPPFTMRATDLDE